MAHHLYHFLSSLVALAALLQRNVALEFDIFNKAASSPGGVRFDKEIGIPFAKQVMETTTKFVWNMLQENSPADRRTDVQVVHMAIDNYIGAEAITYGGACTINVSAVYLLGYRGNLKWEFTSLIYHEMTHIWQWYPPGTPSGLIEGIADYTILKANYYPAAFARLGSGNKWDQGYDFTARFLEYCEGLRPGFVAALNRKMRNTWSLNYFVDLVGKPVDQLWREYKAKYGGRVRNFTEEDTNPGLWREYKDRYYGVKAGMGCQLKA